MHRSMPVQARQASWLRRTSGAVARLGAVVHRQVDHLDRWGRQEQGAECEGWVTRARRGEERWLLTRARLPQTWSCCTAAAHLWQLWVDQAQVRRLVVLVVGLAPAGTSKQGRRWMTDV